MLRYIAILIVLFVECQSFERDAHFTNPLIGRMSWVIESGSLPWTGAYHFLEGSSNPTVLLTVVDSSSGQKLGECKANNENSGWRRFFWTLEENLLLCNISNAEITRISLPTTGNPRTLSARILAENGPRCFRDVIVQNERQKGCPPMLKRNMYQYAALACGCPDASAEDENLQGSVTTADSIVFPIFELTPTSKEAAASTEAGTQNPAFVQLTYSTPLPIQPILNISYLHPTTPGLHAHNFTAPMAKNPCDDMECDNNGTCVVNSDGEPVCLDACSTMLCMNGGECEVINNRGVCVCPSATTGILCEVPLCTPPCGSNGSCKYSNGTATCQCDNGFVGINCNVIDSCANKSACSVYGPDARCSLDAESYSIISPELVEASYDCHCLDKNNHWLECIELYITSTVAPIPSVPAAILPAVSFPPLFELTTENPFVTSVEETTVVHTLAGIRPIQHSLVTPNISSNNEKSKETTEVEKAIEENTLPPHSAETQLPFSFTLDPAEFAGNHSGVAFPLSVLPSETVSTTSSGAKVSASKEEFELFGTPKPSTSSSENKTLWPGQQSPNILHSFTNHTLPEVNISVPATEPTPVTSKEHMVTQEVGKTTVLPIASVESTTTESVWGKSASVPSLPGLSSEQTVPPQTHWPETTAHPFWPEVTSFTAEGAGASESTETSEGAETDGGSHIVLETTTSMQSGENLPPWLRPTTTTEKPEVPGMLTTTESSLLSHFEETTDETPKSVETNAIEEETTPGIEYVTAELTTSAVLEGNGIQESNLKGEKNRKETSKGSSSSWIVAMVAILTLLMLLGAAGLFVLRYVKRSRKLHGKYNPAREENALSSNYSMPMTTVPKEERLI